jgi:CTP-dependent riboflavin kinase
LQSVANQLSDAFIETKKIVKSQIPAANTPSKIEVPIGQSINIATNESKTRLKRGRPIDANDKIHRKRKAQGNEIDAMEEAIRIKHSTKIDQSKLSVQNFLGKESLEEESPEELPP